MVTIVVGEMGWGKTTYLKEWLDRAKQRNKGSLIYCCVSEDFRNENPITSRAKYLDQAVKMKNTLFIVDEAVTFMPSEKPDIEKKEGWQLYTWLVNSRKLNNMIFVVFHSLRDVPLWLLMYTKVFARFQTMDQVNVQARRFKSYTPLYNNLQKFPSLPKFECEEILLR